MKALTIIEQSTGDYFTLYDNDLGSILRKFEGFEFAEVKESIDDVAGPYGSVYVNSKFGRRRVTIEGDLVSSDVYSLRRNLSKALRQTGTIKLFKFTTYDDLNLQFEAEVTKLVNPYTHTIHTFMIEAIAPDWRLYSQDLTTATIAQTAVRGGATIPATIPMSIPVQTSTDTSITNIITNNGNETTDPIITIHGPGTNFTIGNMTADKELLLETTLADDDEVVINVKNRTVVLNGITNVYSDLSGDFWSVLPGENELVFLIQSGRDVALTSMMVEYRDAYTGI